MSPSHSATIPAGKSNPKLTAATVTYTVGENGTIEVHVSSEIKFSFCRVYIAYDGKSFGDVGTVRWSQRLPRGNSFIWRGSTPITLTEEINPRTFRVTAGHIEATRVSQRPW